MLNLLTNFEKLHSVTTVSFVCGYGQLSVGLVSVWLLKTPKDLVLCYVNMVCECP